MKSGILSIYLSQRCKQLGGIIAKHPSYFIIFPIFSTLLLSTGLQRLNFDNDREQLFALRGSRTVKEKQTILALFPTDNTNYYPGRETTTPRGGAVIITSSDGETVFRKEVLKEVSLFDKLIRNISIAIEGRRWTYKDLCAKNKGKCFENSVLTLVDKAEDIVGGNYSVKYPISFSSQWTIFKYFGYSLGGVTLDKDSNVLSAKAIRLLYILEEGTGWKRKLAKQWEVAFINQIHSSFKSIVIDKFSETSIEIELGRILPGAVPLFPFSLFGMLIYSVLSCLNKDWIQSKPWTGLIASTSALFAMVSGFGLLTYCGLVFTVALAPIPFLVLGVGIDDSYVLLAAWNNTDPKRNVVERMAEAYEKSSVAITITSATNCIAFAAGYSLPIPTTKVFSLYASTSVLFLYLYQMTFVGGCMAVCGYIEQQKRHSLTFQRLQVSKGNHDLYATKCFPPINHNVWKHLGKALSKRPVKIFTLTAMSLYMAVGFYGISKIRDRHDVTEFVMYDSPIIPFLDKQYTYFDRYDLSLQVIIDEELDYADPLVQSRIEHLMAEMESTHYIADSSLTESWLRYYLRFLKDENAADLISSYNMSDTKDFIEVLRKLFLRIPAAERFQQDIAFSKDYSAIIGSRFICRSGLIRSQEEHFVAIRHLRNIAGEFSFDVFLYHFGNYIIDGIDIIDKIVLETLGAVTAAIFVICLLSMPDFASVVCVTLTVMTIETTVLGYMALWNISLTPVAALILMTCAGMAVDSSAHMVHAYNTAEGCSQNQRVEIALSSIGMAIFHASATTIISLLPLVYPLSRSLVVGFKIIFLGITFSVFHSLLFLPLLLSMVPFLCAMFSKNRGTITLMKDTNQNTVVTPETLKQGVVESRRM